MRIFIDVDNTIIEHYGFYSYETEARVHKSIGKYPYDNTDAIKTMYESSVCHDPVVLRRLWSNNEVHILTKYPHDVYEHYKQIRIANILGITQEELITAKSNEGFLKYIKVPQLGSKVEVVKDIFRVDDMSDFILVDDYSENIIEWEDYNGIGFKYYNEYNSPPHPSFGITISNFKIFDFYLKNRNFDSLLVVGSNKYKIKTLQEGIQKSNSACQVIDYLKFVEQDLLHHLKVSKVKENRKYSYYNFIIEYYNFRNELDKNYWPLKLDAEICNKNFSLITSTIEPTNGSIDLIEKKVNGNMMTLNILSAETKKTRNVYDGYLTVSTKKYVDSVDDLFLKIMDVFTKLLNIEKRD